MSSKRVRAAVAVASIFGLASCGSASTGTKQQNHETPSSAATVATKSVAPRQPATAGPQLSKAEFFAKADAICRRVNAKVASMQITRGTQFPRFLAVLGTYEQSAATSMDKLNPPSSLTGDWQRIVATTRVVGINTYRVGEAAQFNKLEAESSLIRETEKLRTLARALSKQIGLKDCSKGQA